MADFRLGRLKFNWRGDWTVATAYVIDDIVKLVQTLLFVFQTTRQHRMRRNGMDRMVPDGNSIPKAFTTEVNGQMQPSIELMILSSMAMISIGLSTPTLPADLSLLQTSSRILTD